MHINNYVYLHILLHVCMIHVVLLGSVNTEGSSIAGEPLTLTCSVTRVDNVTGNVVLQWIGPDGAPLTSNETVTVGVPTTSGATTTISIHFSTLYTSNAGQYTCQGELISSDVMYTVLALQDIIVQGRFNHKPVELK